VNQELDFGLSLRLAPAWLPGVASGLSEPLWNEGAGVGISRANYGTERWLTRSAEAPRRGLALSLSNGASVIIEAPLSRSIAERYRPFGLSLDEAPAPDPLGALVQRSYDLFAPAPGLGAALKTLVLVIHPLHAPPQIDISHSDPELPFSIFVSIPSGEDHAELRLAESILHEAMHLQLTLIERSQQLVGDSEARAFSPWQQQDRALSGLVHGLYVFVAIDEWLGHIERADFDRRSRDFAGKRRREISAEIEFVAGLAEAPGLTHEGTTFVRFLLERYGASSAR
jgi:hypothetical protein